MTLRRARGEDREVGDVDLVVIATNEDSHSPVGQTAVAEGFDIGPVDGHGKAIAGRPDGAFSLYTVAETSRAIRASGGLRITPDYTFATTPAPKVIVIPAQNDATDAVKEWIRASSKNADVTITAAFTAIMDATKLYTVSIGRFFYLPII